MPTPKYKIVKTDANVLQFHIDIKAAWEQLILLRSDAHHDNPHCRQDLEKLHLDEALEKGAGIIDTGDLFCAMQGKYDKRSDKSAVRPEHQVCGYLDALVETAADFYQPYAQNWLVMGQGNHETSIADKHETNLTQRLTAILNDRKKASITNLGYTGWVWFVFHRQNYRDRKILWYTHGYGGVEPEMRHYSAPAFTSSAIPAETKTIRATNSLILWSRRLRSYLKFRSSLSSSILVLISTSPMLCFRFAAQVWPRCRCGGCTTRLKETPPAGLARITTGVECDASPCLDQAVRWSCRPLFAK